ncbi:MAG: NAD-dependent epimerase/dehydratase family protein [Chloroflexota bacterium]|nr:NAD-dependent epimerase/dehydratase family protein [Chloroflexota bacterium]
MTQNKSSGEKILLTGGAGFIGSQVARAYLKAGYRVVVVDDFSHGARERLPDHVSVYEVDICDLDALRDLIAAEKPTVINHHAALVSVRESYQQPDRYWRVNAQGTENVIRAATNIELRKFVFASSGGAIYGEGNQHPLDEKAIKEPLSAYGQSKMEAEYAVWFWQTSMEKVVLRYGNVYGPGQNPAQDNGVIAIFAHALLKGEKPVIYGDGLQTRDYVYIDDVVAANLRALEPGKGGIFNIGSGEARTLRNVYAQVAKTLGKEQVVPKRLPANPYEVRHNVLKIDKAVHQLGWQPNVSFERGLEQTVQAIFASAKTEP